MQEEEAVAVDSQIQPMEEEVDGKHRLKVDAGDAREISQHSRAVAVENGESMNVRESALQALREEAEPAKKVQVDEDVHVSSVAEASPTLRSESAPSELSGEPLRVSSLGDEESNALGRAILGSMSEISFSENASIGSGTLEERMAAMLASSMSDSASNASSD